MQTNNRARLGVMIGIAFKLFKSVKVLKVALVAMALSGWTIMLSFEFAVTLLAILMLEFTRHCEVLRVSADANTPLGSTTRKSRGL
jgi:hypothetical protein